MQLSIHCVRAVLSPKVYGWAMILNMLGVCTACNGACCWDAVAALLGLLDRHERIMGMPCARCENAVHNFYLVAAFAISFDNDTNSPEIYYI